jgi:hypothetical protein
MNEQEEGGDELPEYLGEWPFDEAQEFLLCEMSPEDNETAQELMALLEVR